MEFGTDVTEAGGALWVWQPATGTQFKGPTGNWFQKWWRGPRAEPKKLPSASGTRWLLSGWLLSGMPGASRGMGHGTPHSLPATARRSPGAPLHC